MPRHRMSRQLAESRRWWAKHGTVVEQHPLTIVLDPPGAPHWLKDKGRAWLHWFARQLRNRRNLS